MADSVRAVGLRCTSCGSRLEVEPDIQEFACGHCGAEQLVQRRGGIVSLKGVAHAVAKVQVGTDKTAAEMALRRLAEELATARAVLEAVSKEGMEKAELLKWNRAQRARTIESRHQIVFNVVFVIAALAVIALFATRQTTSFRVAGTAALTVVTIFVWYFSTTAGVRAVKDSADAEDERFRTEYQPFAERIEGEHTRVEGLEREIARQREIVEA
jgi:predicted RNA-binding Zn-ribbon protein involved in translation (DUF1610 family)